MRSILLFISVCLFLTQPTAGRAEATPSGTSFAPSSPEAAVGTFYLAIAKRDIALLKSVDPNPTWAKKEEIEKLSKAIVSFRIVGKKRMQSGEGVVAGDMYVGTEEYFEGINKPGKRHFQLRKKAGSWVVVNFNVDE